MRYSRGPLSHAWRLGACSLLACSGVHAATTDIRTIRTELRRAASIALNAAQVAPPSGSPATGLARVSFGSTGLTLHYEITHNVSMETAAHIKQASAGMNGPIQHTLPLGSPKVGDFMMDVGDLSALISNQLYIDIHSVSFPGGAIRGQILFSDVSCQHPPIEGQPVCVKVVVQNLGPDPYVGTGPNLLNDATRGWHRGLPTPSAAGRLKVTVDIDEPSKPGLEGRPRIAATFEEEFAVTIAPGDSATLDFGEVTYTPSSGGLHEATTTSTAQAPNVDPNPSNDTRTTQFLVTVVTPALRHGVVGLLAVALGLTAMATLRRRTAPRR